MTRSEALTLLLALPDEPCMRRRAYRYTCARDPRRPADAVKRELGTAYVERRRQERTDRDGDISCVVSVRRRPGLRIVGRA